MSENKSFSDPPMKKLASCLIEAVSTVRKEAQRAFFVDNFN
ncbi:hypothetical protein QNI16_07575 [Cytophagaceae bacterium YF14B1]|uniref:Uncharacterized protein n=1 Tax=Xanthocytophaga flava TaxID=3048013 RepID=A0AAE3QP76_9BACT|nr:hypothetical protein [Xanthocytophaga flavus]MDJ1480339.1 hypothetical protein [Xanthocytophaga flavus]